jgi:hypothetical protein
MLQNPKPSDVTALKNLSLDYMDSSVGHASWRAEVGHQQTHHELSAQNPIHCSRSDVGSENVVGTHRQNLSDRISEDRAVQIHNYTTCNFHLDVTL